MSKIQPIATSRRYAREPAPFIANERQKWTKPCGGTSKETGRPCRNIISYPADVAARWQNRPPGDGVQSGWEMGFDKLQEDKKPDHPLKARDYISHALVASDHKWKRYREDWGQKLNEWPRHSWNRYQAGMQRWLSGRCGRCLGTNVPQLGTAGDGYDYNTDVLLDEQIAGVDPLVARYMTADFHAEGCAGVVHSCWEMGCFDVHSANPQALNTAIDSMDMFRPTEEENRFTQALEFIHDRALGMLDEATNVDTTNAIINSYRSLILNICPPKEAKGDDLAQLVGHITARTLHPLNESNIQYSDSSDHLPKLDADTGKLQGVQLDESAQLLLNVVWDEMKDREDPDFLMMMAGLHRRFSHSDSYRGHYPEDEVAYPHGHIPHSYVSTMLDQNSSERNSNLLPGDRRDYTPPLEMWQMFLPPNDDGVASLTSGCNFVFDVLEKNLKDLSGDNSKSDTTLSDLHIVLSQIWHAAHQLSTASAHCRWEHMDESGGVRLAANYSILTSSRYDESQFRTHQSSAYSDNTNRPSDQNVLSNPPVIRSMSSNRSWAEYALIANDEEGRFGVIIPSGDKTEKNESQQWDTFGGSRYSHVHDVVGDGSATALTIGNQNDMGITVHSDSTGSDSFLGAREHRTARLCEQNVFPYNSKLGQEWYHRSTSLALQWAEKLNGGNIEDPALWAGYLMSPPNVFTEDGGEYKTMVQRASEAVAMVRDGDTSDLASYHQRGLVVEGPQMMGVPDVATHTSSALYGIYDAWLSVSNPPIAILDYAASWLPETAQRVLDHPSVTEEEFPAIYRRAKLTISRFKTIEKPKVDLEYTNNSESGISDDVASEGNVQCERYIIDVPIYHTSSVKNTSTDGYPIHLGGALLAPFGEGGAEAIRRCKRKISVDKFIQQRGWCGVCLGLPYAATQPRRTALSGNLGHRFDREDAVQFTYPQEVIAGIKSNNSIPDNNKRISFDSLGVGLALGHIARNGLINSNDAPPPFLARALWGGNWSQNVNLTSRKNEPLITSAGERRAANAHIGSILTRDDNNSHFIDKNGNSLPWCAHETYSIDEEKQNDGDVCRDHQKHMGSSVIAALAASPSECANVEWLGLEPEPLRAALDAEEATWSNPISIEYNSRQMKQALSQSENMLTRLKIHEVDKAMGKVSVAANSYALGEGYLRVSGANGFEAVVWFDGDNAPTEKNYCEMPLMADARDLVDKGYTPVRWSCDTTTEPSSTSKSNWVDSPPLSTDAPAHQEWVSPNGDAESSARITAEMTFATRYERSRAAGGDISGYGGRINPIRRIQSRPPQHPTELFDKKGGGVEGGILVHLKPSDITQLKKWAIEECKNVRDRGDFQQLGAITPSNIGLIFTPGDKDGELTVTPGLGRHSGNHVFDRLKPLEEHGPSRNKYGGEWIEMQPRYDLEAQLHEKQHEEEIQNETLLKFKLRGPGSSMSIDEMNASWGNATRVRDNLTGALIARHKSPTSEESYKARPAFVDFYDPQNTGLQRSEKRRLALAARQYSSNKAIEGSWKDFSDIEKNPARSDLSLKQLTKRQLNNDRSSVVGEGYIVQSSDLITKGLRKKKEGTWSESDLKTIGCFTTLAAQHNTGVVQHSNPVISLEDMDTILRVARSYNAKDIIIRQVPRITDIRPEEAEVTGSSGPALCNFIGGTRANDLQVLLTPKKGSHKIVFQFTDGFRAAVITDGAEARKTDAVADSAYNL